MLQPFGKPTLVVGLNGFSGGITTTRFTPDERVAVATINSDIALVFRWSRLAPFENPSFLTSVNSGSDDGSPTLTDDGLTLYLYSDRDGFYGLYRSTRAGTDVDFSTPTLVPGVNVFGEGNPYVTGDGSALYFHSWRDGTADLWRATRMGDGFASPEKLAVSTDDLHEYAPVVSPDELTLYYLGQSRDTGQMGTWMATRTSMQQPFGNAVLLSELSGDFFDSPGPVWVSPDACRLYITAYALTTRVGLLLVAERPSP